MLIPQESVLAACSNGDTSKLQELVQASSDAGAPNLSKNFVQINPPNTDGMLANAVQSANVETVQFVLQTYPKTTVTEEAVRHAIDARSIPLYNALLSHDPSITKMTIYDGRQTQLSRALCTGTSTEYIEFLLSVGINPNTHIDDDGAPNPLPLAMGRWQTRSLDLIAILLKHGTQLKGSGALHVAASRGKNDVVEFLLSQGADVNDVDVGSYIVRRYPALHAAVKAGHGHVVRTLLRAGADREILDAQGMTAYAVAEAKGDEEMINLIHNWKG